jgi:hypothetical protein
VNDLTFQHYLSILAATYLAVVVGRDSLGVLEDVGVDDAVGGLVSGKRSDSVAQHFNVLLGI